MVSNDELKKAVETIKWLPLYRLESICGCNSTEGKALRTAVEAIERMIPCSVEDWAVSANCPFCGWRVDEYGDEIDYCPNCGQAIDWGGHE